MRNHTFSICVGVLAAITIAGCGGVSEKDVIGNWTGKVDRSSSSVAAGDNVPEGMEAIANAMAEMLSFDLEIKKDHTFKLTMMFIPMEGSWELKGNEVILTTESMFGMSADDVARMGGQGGTAPDQEPMVLRVSKDRKTMTTVDPSGATSGELLFTRKDDS